MKQSYISLSLYWQNNHLTSQTTYHAFDSPIKLWSCIQVGRADYEGENICIMYLWSKNVKLYLQIRNVNPWFNWQHTTKNVCIYLLQHTLQQQSISIIRTSNAPKHMARADDTAAHLCNQLYVKPDWSEYVKQSFHPKSSPGGENWNRPNVTSPSWPSLCHANIQINDVSCNMRTGS